MGGSLLRVWHELIRVIDTRVCDLTVYDDTGSVLVAMTGFELRRSSTSPFPGIERRYEVALQPVVTSISFPRCPTHWSRPNKETADLIVTIADHEAQLLLRRSLDRGVIVGDDLNRQRYHQFAQDAIARPLPPLPSPAVVEDIKTKWPIYFQVVDRLSHVHHDVFESSTVSIYYLGTTKPFSLTASQATVRALFSDDILNKFYSSGDGLFGPICEAAANAFDRTITAFAESGKRVLRVLEIGAGKYIS